MNKDHKIGHRERLKNRFLKSSLESLPDYEIIEMLLFLSIPRKDVKYLAKELAGHFGGIGKLINAEEHELLEFNGIGQNTIATIRLLKEINLRANKEIILSNPIISCKNELIRYFRSSIGHGSTEKIHVLYLNNKNRIIKDDILEHGTINHVAIYPREIIKKAIYYNATAIILVHNHPSGNAQPSSCDIQQTNILKEALDTIEVKFHDHVIISSNCYFSFKSNNLLK